MDAPLLESQVVDVDVFVKVVSNTMLSPFFAIWVPIFYKSQGLPWTSPIIFWSCLYVLSVFLFRGLRSIDRRWRNGTLFGSGDRIDWSEQVVVITGGAGGIGGLLANTLAIRGVTVAIMDVVPLVTENHNIEYYKCDVSNYDEVQHVAAKIVEELGHPTILVNNAGVVQGKLITELSEADVKQTFGVNSMAHFWTLKAFLPHMIQEKAGHIISMSSIMGLVGAAQVADYSASKAAVVTLHESLRYELDHKHNTPNIRTTLVLPGYTNTAMFSRSSYHKILRRSFIHRFFVPPVQPQDIVKGIISAIDAQESRDIILPFYGNFVRPLTAILPSWGRDFLQWASQADHAMEDFVKVTGRRDDEGALKAEKQG
ncbi:hypothetical protein FRC04_007560 [Tulasnella sp. 424]|nr:hypothetical protein FRC04_007560 [Tulasnella sp. 424]KAG8978995.1 hypothetical protein FRC05_009205 [Tulasnella sp. 425]